MAWLLYRALTASLMAAAAPFLLARRSRHYLATLPGRRGRHPDVERCPRLWVHAVSVGEVGVAATLLRALPSTLPVVLTTTTPTGQEVAQRTLGERCDVTYFPFDLKGPVYRFFDHYTPRALVLVEGDYWPFVLHESRARGLPIAVVNGRVSARGARRQRPFRPLLGTLYDPVRSFAMQTEIDRERLIALGADPGRITVTGNLKFETPEPPALPELERSLAALADGRPLVVAGSTMPNEEGAVLSAFRDVGSERALLLLAPRHPERCDEVERLVREGGFSLLRRSAFDRSTHGGRPDVVLLDTLGELAALYRVAGAAFIGGTLVATGGHNPLEAAVFETAIAAGPSMHNFPEIEHLMDAGKAWRRVADPGELAAALREWIERPEEAARLGRTAGGILEANRGASSRTLELLEPLLREAGL
jgi:3-deoxy-D-manno-octulosonic-acid transferase